MSILVTGGAGYIGSHVLYELLDRGYSVVVLDNLVTGFRHGVPEGIPFVVGDVGDKPLLAKVLAEHRVQAVMHFAASSIVPDSMINPVQYYTNNTVKSLSLIDAAVGAGVRYFVFSSTAAVYGNPEMDIVEESSALKPLSPYGASKLMTETMLQDIASASDLRYVALRYFNVAGADPKLRTGQSSRTATHLIKVALQAALKIRNGMDLFGSDYPTRDGTCIRDYIHVSDLANAHIQALEYLRAGGANATLNCGYGHGYSVREVVDVVKKVSGHDFPVAMCGRRPGDPAVLVSDVAKIKKAFSWTPRYDDLEVIVQHALAWEKKLNEQGEQVGAELAGSEPSSAGSK